MSNKINQYVSNSPILHTEHTGFTVSSLDEALHFWCEVMGFELVARKDLGGGSVIENIVGVPGADIRVATVRAPGGHKIELLEYRGPGDRQIYRPRSCDVGSVHLTFAVSNIDEMIARVEAVQWGRLGPIETLPNGTRAAYVRGPDGHTLEFMQFVAV